ncbi:MAG: exodeoxyribonuclease VII small subunit [Verrucomicrobiota bacterium]|nr:exodeoxyribonuclease VII small subunit [Verrucomicrobiota bacterium]
MAIQSSADEPGYTFETAIERLEAIVEQMDSDKLPLEELLVRFEEGVKLVKVCQERLGAAEKRIELITRNAAGKAQLEPFEPDAVRSSPAHPSSAASTTGPAS